MANHSQHNPSNSFLAIDIPYASRAGKNIQGLAAYSIFWKNREETLCWRCQGTTLCESRFGQLGG